METTISREEENALVLRAQAGDREALAQVEVCYRSMVRTIVWRVTRKSEYLYSLIEDLYQEGMIGLFNAVKCFKLDGDFRAYVHYRIEGAMLDALRKSHLLSEVPRKHFTYCREFHEVQGVLSTKLGRTPTLREVKEALSPKAQAVFEEIRFLEGFGTYADLAVGKHDEELLVPVYDPLVADDGATPETLCEEEEELAEFLRIFWKERREFDAREEAIFAVVCEVHPTATTLKEAGKAFGVSESRISQIKTVLLERLRDALRHVNGSKIPARELALF